MKEDYTKAFASQKEEKAQYYIFFHHFSWPTPMKIEDTKDYWDIDMKPLITQVILKNQGTYKFTEANQAQNGMSINIEAGLFQAGLE